MTPHFDIPLNLPHAGTVAGRIAANLGQRLDPKSAGHRRVNELVGALGALLSPYRESGENPGREESERVRGSAAELGRALVDEIERQGLGSDRLGQCVRNLFECLEFGREGAEISLRAGEDPKSLQRPT